MFARTHRTQLLLPLLTGLTLCASLPSQAVTARQYVAMRRKDRCDRRLTLATVRDNPANYVGKVLELRGTVNCKAEAGANITISLELADKSAPILDVPVAEADVLRGSFSPRLRALVQVDTGGSGNVTPLKVLAVADDNEVDVLDRQAEAQMNAEARREALEEQANAQYRASRSGLASRGSFHRGPAPVAGDAAAQAAVYVPRLPGRVRQCFIPYFRYIADQNRRLDSRTVGQITFHLLNYASTIDVDPRLVVAILMVESEFDPMSTSHSGAMGLGQLMPGTAQGLGVVNAYDVEQNLYGAITYLKEQLNTFRAVPGPDGTLPIEQIRLAVAAYNAGPNAVLKYGGIPPYRETQAYVRHVESRYRSLCSG